ncbi:ATP-dependent DNA helicase [Evansella clarkii]|uniref:ATP-dependent DNA helicase n=1 Tax=Evansella clarkii TaxID=79879 RepID=UPI000995ED9D|nr:ATP-dependent DNA helicase [Evansella clarkii]
MSREIRISVRPLVEYAFRSGSIDAALQVKNTALLDGVKTHQRVQGQYGVNDRKEVPLECTVEYKDFTFQIEGRCDGLLKDEEGKVTIDEIKSSQRGVGQINAEGNEVHWAQAKLYGFMYAKDHRLEDIAVQVTYADVDSDEIKSAKKVFTLTELEMFLYKVLDEYIKFASVKAAYEEVRQASVKQLNFPFAEYREGQRKLAASVYQTILDKKKLYVKAPTGIGKTISTVFPAVKAIGEGKISKVVYVTAKTITRTVAEETFDLLREKGLRMKTCTITAKDKVCFKEETICQPDYCEFADGYYDRINGAILDIFENEDKYDRETIERYARKHTVCPFEFSLDLSMVADGIICDYNYIFDPRVALRRLSDSNRKNYTLLVDEAHNLVDRARSMYSASLNKSDFLSVKRLFTGKDKGISTVAGEINSYLLKLKKEEIPDERYTTRQTKPAELEELLEGFLEACEAWLLENRGSDLYEDLLEVYFNANNYMKICRLYDDHFITYLEQFKSEVIVKILCLNPSRLLKEYTKNYRGSVFFSATLIPGHYYKDMLGGTEDDYTLALTSPFDKDNLDVSIAGISVRYKDRERTSGKIADLIYKTVAEQGRKGNSLVFFPSYQYMNLIFEEFTEKYPDVPVLVQEGSMNEEERERFLQEFKSGNEGVLAGFAVLGGIFSEGIDLKGDRLGGVVIIGTGLPQFNTEQEIMKEYFQTAGKNGYDYAYVYPGISKVLQAGGRLIRTETDTGTLLLIDDRFLTPKYQQLLPAEWRNFRLR